MLSLKKAGKNKRRTLRKCYENMEANLDAAKTEQDLTDIGFCRNTGVKLADCKGDCWGFWGDKQEEKKNQEEEESGNKSRMSRKNR